MNTFGLFPGDALPKRGCIGRQAFVLREFALSRANEVLSAISAVEARAPFRNMTTPGGHTMSVALTSCGEWGWTSDRRGYRYSAVDPNSGLRWPAIPHIFMTLARDAAGAVGFSDFAPDACLINRYVPGTRLSLHQDRNEIDFGAPIVSVSLGMSATFLFGGLERTDRTDKVVLHHGDVVVWGGVDRMRYHGVNPVKGLPHAELGYQRLNLTFRKAG